MLDMRVTKRNEIMYLLLVSLNYLFGMSMAQVTSDGCYRMMRNVKANGLMAFQRRIGVSEKQCLDTCTQNCGDCQSVQYNCMSGTCDLFCSVANCMGRKKKREAQIGGLQGPAGRGRPFVEGWERRYADDENPGQGDGDNGEGNGNNGNNGNPGNNGNNGEGPSGPGEGPSGPGEGPSGPGEGPSGPGEGPSGPGEGPSGPGEGPSGPGPSGPGEGPSGPGPSGPGPSGPGPSGPGPSGPGPSGPGPSGPGPSGPGPSGPGPSGPGPSGPGPSGPGPSGPGPSGPGPSGPGPSGPGPSGPGGGPSGPGGGPSGPGGGPSGPGGGPSGPGGGPSGPGGGPSGPGSGGSGGMGPGGGPSGSGGGGCTSSRCQASRASSMLVSVHVRRKKRGMRSANYNRGRGNNYRSRSQGYTYQRTNYGGGCAGLVNCPGTNYYVPTGNCRPAGPAPATPAPLTDDCPQGKVSRYFVYEGYKMSGGETSFTADSEQACLQACTASRKPDGTAAKCQTVDYDSSSKMCTISSQIVQADQLQKAGGSKHYQKICVDAAFGQRCPGPYFVDPQHILVGFAQSVTNAGSMEECLQICANSQARFGFQCVSGMFYFGEGGDNCILNKETRTTQPDKYQEENQDKVTYYELDCTVRALRASGWWSRIKARNRNVLPLQVANFGNWTMCDRKTLRHIRYKDCVTRNPKKCQKIVRPCDPLKEEEYDFPEDATSTTTTSKTTPSTSKTTETTTTASTASMTSTASVSTSAADNVTISQTTEPTIISSNPQPPPKKTTSSKESIKSTKTTASTLQPPASSTTKSRSQEGGEDDDLENVKTAEPVNRTCQPILRDKGEKDCSHGVRLGTDGKKQRCKPDKKDCP